VGLPSIQRLDPINIDVYPDYLMAELRQASGVGRTQIVRADNAYLQCHSQIFARLAVSVCTLAPLLGKPARSECIRPGSSERKENTQFDLDLEVE
jgi:hypothetical protein